MHKFWLASRHFPTQPSQGREQSFCLLDSSCSNPRQVGLNGSHCSACWHLLEKQHLICSQPLKTSSDADTTVTNASSLLEESLACKLLRACVLPSPPPQVAKKLEPQIPVASPEPAWGAGGPELEDASHASAALGWASAYMTQPALGMATNLPCSFLHGAALEGCFSQPLNVRGQPAVKFSRKRGRDFYLCWIQLSSLSSSHRSKGKCI